MESRSFNAPKEPSVGKQRWRCDPARRSSGTKWEKEGREESNVEGYVSVARVLDFPDNECAACFGPTTHGGITRKTGRGAGATGAEAPGPEMVAPSVGRESTRLDCRHFGNGGAGQSAQEVPHREPRGHGQEESRRATTRGNKERKVVLKRANSGVLQQRRGPWERRRIQGETDRCLKARSATPLRLGDDAAPPGKASRGLQVPRSGGGVTGRRRMVSRTPSRSVARSDSVDNVIWSSGSGSEGRTSSSPAAPGSMETEPTNKNRPRSALEERGRRRRTASRSAKKPGEKEEDRPPEGSTVEQPGPSWSERTEQGKANQVAVAGEVVPLVVCGAQRVSLSEEYLGKELPPHSVYKGRSWGSHGNPGGWGNPF